MRNVAERSAREFVSEEPIELRRQLDALRRARVWIVLFVIAVTGAVVGLSLLLPKTYRATSTVVLQETLNPFGSTDVDAVVRRLETIERLLGTKDVLDRAAAEVPGESGSSLESKVTSSVDQSANIIKVSATDDTADGAAAIANAVANTFLEEQTNVERQRIGQARANLERELARLRGTGSAEERAAIRQQIIELSVSQVSAGSELQLAQAAEPPTAPYTPRPVRNGVLAFFAALFLGVLVALGRDRLVPRIGSPRDLSRLTNLPVLAGVPYVRRRFGRRPKLLSVIADEAYQTLQASVRFQLPPDHQHVLLVTSAVQGEGKSNVAAGLGRALARVGQKTLLVSADLRFPTLHELFDTSREPGLSDLLRYVGSDGMPTEQVAAAFDRSVRTSLRGASSQLHLVPSGSRSGNPSTLLFSNALEAFFAAVGRLDYSYVIVDGAPLLGIADSHVLAQRADGVLIVSRVERLTLEDVIEMSDVLDRLEINPLGVVVVGARRGGAYAYAGAGLTSDEVETGRLPV